MTRIGIFYPYNTHQKMNIEYYTNVHLPMWIQLNDTNLLSHHTETGVCICEDGVTTLYEAITYFEYAGPFDFQEVFGRHQHLFWSDLSNFCSVTPMIRSVDRAIAA